MPAKSKHNRRKIQSRRIFNDTTNTISGPKDLNIATVVTGSSRSESPALRTPKGTELNSSEVVNEIKWIGIVTGIVLVCLALAYLFFH